MNKRNRVLAMICGLMTILMLDRVCLSVAGPRMQAALHIGPAEWGWVNEVFADRLRLFRNTHGRTRRPDRTAQANPAHERFPQ